MDKKHNEEKLNTTDNNKETEEEIDLRELIETLLKRKWAIVTLMVVAIMVAGVFSVFVQREEYVTTVLKLDFAEIEQEQYPDGSDFNPDDIVSPHILSQVARELELEEHELGVGDLLGMVEVRELFYPADDDDEEPEPAYQYRLIIEGEEEISPSLQRQILSSVVENYRKEYSQAFIDRPFFPRISEEEGELMALDYPFMNRNLEAYQEMFMDHLEELLEDMEDMELGEVYEDMEDAEEFEGYYSSEHGMSFRELKRRAQRLKETTYGDLAAIIRANSLTDDPEGAIRHYENMIQELELSQAKKRQEADYVREMLDDARPLRTGSLPELFPAIIEEGEQDLVGEIFDTLYRDNFYPQLIQVSMEAAEDSIEASHEISRLESEIERMEELEDETENFEDLKERADELTRRVVRELNQLVNINNEMMEEYYALRVDEGINYAVMPYHDVERGNLELNVALAAVLGLMVGVFGSFFHEFWQKSDPRRDSNKDSRRD